MLTTTLVHVPFLQETITCEECQSDIPAYIDYEHLIGIVAAVREYPNVWWHLWTCRTCAEIYEGTKVLIEAEARGRLVSMPHSSLKHAPSQLIARLQLLRSMVSDVLFGGPTLGVEWGESDTDTVLIDEELMGYQVILSVQKQTPEYWSVIVALTPADAGQVSVAFGDRIFRSTIEPGAEAVISHIPVALLSGENDSEMMVEIEV